MGIQLELSERGGDVTYHGPGQLVAYPIFDLDVSGRDLHRWLRDLEETVIRCVAGLGLSAYRLPPHTGVWIDSLKVCAIGVKVRRWVSMRGLALNCNNDLTPFASIIPCGIKEYGVTSISERLGREVTVDEVKPKLVAAFKERFSGYQPSAEKISFVKL
jgi:lipoate-protein ligase B